MDDDQPRTGLGLFAAAVAFLLPVAFSPSVRSTFWSPRAAVLLLVVAVGAPRLPGLLRGRTRPAAACALVFVGVSLASAILADEPALSLAGLYNWGTGAVFVAALASAWAIGAHLDQRGRRDVALALLGGVALNALAAVAGLVVDLEVLRVGPGGRSAGLQGNPVQLGGFLAAGLGLVIAALRSHPAAAAGSTFATAAALQLSGSRFALALALAVALVSVRGWGRRPAGFVLAGLALGVAAGALVADLAGRESGTARLDAEATSSLGVARLETWRSAAGAVAERPVLGAGPGRFRSATSDRRTFEAARAEGADRLFADAHNLVVEYGVTTGLVGLAALLAWLALAGRGAGGPLLVFAAALLASHLLQPQSVGTTPLAFLALGAAGPLPVGQGAGGRPARLATATLALAALVAGAVLLVGDFRMEQARLDLQVDDAAAADYLLPFWPETAELLSRANAFESIVQRDPARRAEARDWLERAARRDASDPRLWNNLGDFELKDGRPEAGEASYRRALRHNPWSARALAGLGRVRLAQGRPREAVSLLERSHRLTPSPSVSDLLESARRGAGGGPPP